MRESSFFANAVWVPACAGKTEQVGGISDCNFMASYEADEFESYTSLSAVAVCALLLGLASPLALLAPLMVVVPLAGVIVALLALVRIGNSAGALSGRKLAYWGLALSILCGIASPLRVSVRDNLYGRQADRTARAWLDLLSKNETRPALSYLTGNAMVGLNPPTSPDSPRPEPDPQIDALNLGKHELVLKLREEALHGEIEFALRNMTCDGSAINPRVALQYQTVKPDDSLTLRVVLLRSLAKPGWLVDSWNLEGETAHSHPH